MAMLISTGHFIVRYSLSDGSHILKVGITVWGNFRGICHFGRAIAGLGAHGKWIL